MEITNVDPIGISVILFQIFLLILILKYTSLRNDGIIVWSILFIVRNLIPVVGMILEHAHNNFIEMETPDFISKLGKIAIALIFCFLAIKISFEKKS